jgi:hypothetical protein
MHYCTHCYHCCTSHSWEEFAELFKLIGDSEYAAGQLMKAELRGLVQVALLKLTMGSQPDPAEHLAAFLGMPSNCRRVSTCTLAHIALTKCSLTVFCSV